MINLTRGVGTWALLGTGFMAAFGADQAPVEAIRPAGGPDLAVPGALPQEPIANEPVGGQAATSEKKAVPLLDALVQERADREAAEQGDETITGSSAPSPVPSAVKPRHAPTTQSKMPRAAAAKSDPTDSSGNTSLDARVDEAVAATSRRALSIETHTPWQIGHGMLAYRKNYLLRDDGNLINAFDWVKKNPTYTSQTPDPNANSQTRELPWFYRTKYGARPQRYTGQPYEFEGHPNQFLAFFALSRIPRDYEFTVDGRTVTYGQMLYNAKMEINDREEVTWNLWAFAYYFDMDDRWINAAGERWSMEKVVATALRQFSPTKSPCGGTHTLFAIASARNAYLQTSGSQLTGVWTKAHMHLEEHIALAKSMQNADGSFSSEYFKGPGYSSDPSKRISTSGHTLEFLMVALPQNRLSEPWVNKGVEAVARDLIEYQNEPLDVGGMYHAAHALVLFRERTRPEFAAGAVRKQPTRTATSPRRERLAR